VELLYDDEEQREKEMLKNALKKTAVKEDKDENLALEDDLRREIEEAQFNAMKK